MLGSVQEKRKNPSGHMVPKWRRINVDAMLSRRISINTTSFYVMFPMGLILCISILLSVMTYDVVLLYIYICNFCLMKYMYRQNKDIMQRWVLQSEVVQLCSKGLLSLLEVPDPAVSVFVSPAKQKRDICIAFPALSLSSAAAA